jgi:predicted RNA binding protein YcfA (HicA-like mRNA interferase family)
MATLYRDLERLLRDAGCEFVRQGKGSHEIWLSPMSGRTFAVPATLDNKPLANAILKQAGLPKAF